MVYHTNILTKNVGHIVPDIIVFHQTPFELLNLSAEDLLKLGWLHGGRLKELSLGIQLQLENWPADQERY